MLQRATTAIAVLVLVRRRLPKKAPPRLVSKTAPFLLGTLMWELLPQALMLVPKTPPALLQQIGVLMPALETATAVQWLFLDGQAMESSGSSLGRVLGLLIALLPTMVVVPLSRLSGRVILAASKN